MTLMDDSGLLSGKTIVLTRSEEQQSEANQVFRAIGANVLDLPALTIGPPDQWGPLDDALLEIETFHWIVFSSANGVLAVNKRLEKFGKNWVDLSQSLKVAAVGRKTAHYLGNLGAYPDFVPPNFVAESLIQHFPVSGLGLKILLPRVQSGGRTFLAEAFSSAGANVVEVAAYESSCPEKMPEETALAFDNANVDAIAFTSGKTALHTAQLMKKRFGNQWLAKIKGVKVLSIGPQTTKSCIKNLLHVDEEAQPHDLEGLRSACVRALIS